MEFLPESVLARTERLIAWWTPPQKRPMFSGTTCRRHGRNEWRDLSPQPALVWLAMDHSLSIRALKENRRPAADTKLCVAPYWNVYDTGSVCGLGSMRFPMPPPSPPFPSGPELLRKASLRMATCRGLRAIPAASEVVSEGTRRQRYFHRLADRVAGNGARVGVWKEARLWRSMKHALPKSLSRRGQPLRVLIVGAGGNGSAVLLGLPYLHQAMKVKGNVGGLHAVMLVDGSGL